MTNTEVFDSNEFLTTEDVSKLFKSSYETVWRWRKTNPEFPKPVKVGRRQLWFKADILTYMKSLKEKTNE